MNYRYRVLIPKPVQKELDDLPGFIHKKIISSISALEDNPRPHGCLKLSGREGWRIKVGEYRVIYEIDDKEQTALLLRVAHRREIYR
jgi:mRNA interferase RelE/StbE